MLNLIDEFTHECLSIRVDWKLKSTDVIARLRDALLDGETFYPLAEARIVIESWRRRYSTERQRLKCSCLGRAGGSATPTICGRPPLWSDCSLANAVICPAY
jgi:hypothetical protein